MAKKYFKGGLSGGVISFHLPLIGRSVALLNQTIQSSSLLVAAVSLGESHTLLPPGHSGNAKGIFGEEPDIEKRSGYGTFLCPLAFPNRLAQNFCFHSTREWYRLAIGLQPANEIIKELLRVFALQEALTTELGVVKKFIVGTGKLNLKLTPVASDPAIGATGPLFIKKGEDIVLIDVKATVKRKSKSVELTIEVPYPTDETKSTQLLDKGTSVFCFTPALFVTQHAK